MFNVSFLFSFFCYPNFDLFSLASQLEVSHAKKHLQINLNIQCNALIFKDSAAREHAHAHKSQRRFLTLTASALLRVHLAKPSIVFILNCVLRKYCV